MTASSTTQYNRYDDQRAAEQRAAHEPSMEEILASIRRIIADDEVLPLTRTPAAAPPSAPPMSAPPASRLPPAPMAPPPSSYRNSITPPSAENSGLGGVAANRFASIVRKPTPSLLEKPAQPRDYAAPPLPSATADYGYPPPHSSHAAAPRDPYQAPPLLSPQADASIANSFQNLASSLAGGNAVLERSVTEALKPMLKQWLDDNLPILVERLVRAEIERVARGGRNV